MDKNTAQLAKNLGARHVGTLPDVGGGAFGAARLALLLERRLAPSTGKRPGRPTDEQWTEQRKVPMSAQTLAALQELSARMSSARRKISPMQLAAQLLEEGVVQIAPRKRRARKSGSG